METRAQRRLRKLKSLCDTYRHQGGVVYVATRARLAPNTVDQILKGALLPPRADGTQSPRSLGDRAAAAIERAFDLPSGWFDSDDTNAVREDGPVYTVDIVPMETVVHRMADLIAELPPSRWASVRAQLDLIATSPAMRDDAIAEVVQLLSLPSKHRAAA